MPHGFFLGSDIEVLDYSGSLGYYQSVPDYPRPLHDEIDATNVPSSVNAADMVDDTLYMLQGNIMYSYDVSGSIPDINYSFLSNFDMSINDAGNPFSALIGSPLPSPPTAITAMVFDEDGSQLMVFCQRQLYLLTIATGHWEYKGSVATPCG